MIKHIINNFALVLSADNKEVQIISRCCTYTDFQVIEFQTEPEALLYAIDNNIELPEMEGYK